ncbi:hypothetical protein SBRCBS47491_006587 [Sporothrix bragantina]|uniref:beta-glucosidase n=1 Tax=Sporothrix bragantina TaxID=671064 RepID=A0ABP0C8G4_9PEZI
MASQVVQGIQSRGVAATLKHFVANEQETGRMTIDTTISERTLREVYLRPFEIAVKEARPWAIMTAYNKVNGDHCDSSRSLLTRVLRGDWGWDGLVMSDWGGTNSLIEGLNAGTDLEMPSPPRWRQAVRVHEAITRGQLTEETISTRVCAVIRLLHQVGAFIPDRSKGVETSNDRPEDRALIREAGAKGCVLLKNEKGVLLLTLDKARGKTIAVIGQA